MTKKEIIEALINDTNLTRSQATKAFESIFTTIGKSLAFGDDVFIRGFGTLKVTTRAARKARDIKHNKLIDIPAHSVVKYKPSPAIKKALELNEASGSINHSKKQS